MIFIEQSRMSLLPTVARQIVREMGERYNDNQVLAQASAKRLDGLTKRLHALDIRFMGDGRITEAEANERKRLQQDHDSSSRRHSALMQAERDDAQMFAAIDRWLSTAGRTNSHISEAAVELIDVPLPEAKGDLEAVRSEIASLAGKRHAAQRAPLSRQELEAAVRRRVADMANRGKPMFRGVNGNSHFDIVFRDVKPATALAWFDPDRFAERLIADLPPASGDAMSASAKRKTLADLDTRQLELERLEEALVRATQGAQRRPDADVRAILSIEERPRRAAAA